MSEIAIEQQQYKTYVLSDGNAQVSVVPERGGIVTRWQIGGKDVFYLDGDRFKDPALTVRGGIPILFPICGNLVEDTYSLNNQTYKLPSHGFARNLPWQVTQQSTEAGASITLTLKSNDTTRSSYPFDFELDYIYTLHGNSLELRCRHTNLSAQPMPFSTGIHPYFAVADKSHLSVDFPSDEYQSKGGAEAHSFSGEFDFEQEEIDVSFTNLQGRSASVTDQGGSLKLTLEYDDHYSTLVFWAVKGKDFYCLEPWTAPRNAFNTGKNLLVAEPGAMVETMIKMTIEMA